MPGLRPTLIIGLGTTGLHVIDYFRQFLLEEYGTMDLPCLQTLCFETRSDAPSRTDVRIKPLTIPSTDAVKYQMKHPLDNQGIKVEGYEKWLPPDVLEMGDSFDAGAGSRRAAGRLILWENWEPAKKEIDAAIRKCTLPESILTTTNLLKDHYEKERIAYNPAKPLVTTDDLVIYVIGTLCGGSCSGMFPDLGFLIRSIREKSKRILIATTLTESQAKQEDNNKLAANCYGAMKELDFYYQRLPESAWSYKLPDDTTVKPGDEPYYLAYLVSIFNGKTDLEGENAVNQMVAMNVFLDVVGQGYTSKVGAIKDLESDMADRKKDADGFVRQFYSFGLSAVWYPKSKITGIAACDLGAELCDKWLGSSETVKASEIKEHVEADFTALKSAIDEEILEKLGPMLNRLENTQKPAMIADRLRKPSDVLREAGDQIAAECQAVDERLREIVRDAQRLIDSQLRDRVFKTYKDSAKSDAYWAMYFKYMEQHIGAQVSVRTPEFSLKTRSLQALQDAASRAQDDKWVKAVYMHKQVNRFYREQFIDQAVREWKAEAADFTDSRRRAVLGILRCDQRDQKIIEKYYPEEVVNSFTQTESSWLAKLAQSIKAVAEEIQLQRKAFEGLGGSRVVHQVFSTGSMGEDIEDNKKQTKKNNITPLAVSVQWHLVTDERRPASVNTEQEFWASKPQAIAAAVVKNYQREGLKYLPLNLADAPIATLQSLAGHASPYAETNGRFRAIATPRETDFIFGGMETERLHELGRALNIMHLDNQCQYTGLRHILFIYKELRCFAMDALKVFDAAKGRAASHPHLTHKEPSFFDCQRIENTYLAEVLMQASLLLFPDAVYENAATRPRFSYIHDNNPEDFIPGNEESYARMARVSGALEAFKVKIRKALRALMLQGYNDLHLAKAKAVNDALYDAVDPEQKASHAYNLSILKAFRERFAPEVFPELKPGRHTAEV